MKREEFSSAFRVTIPVRFGYLAIGIPFGLMLVSKGYPWYLAPFMSLCMYAGAGQYIAVGLFASGASLSAMIITTLMVNIRHIVYGLSLITDFKAVGRWKPYLVFALTDETYALLTGVKVPEGADSGRFYGLIALLNQSYWICGSLIGAVAGKLIPFPLTGIDFALTSLFIVLLIDQLERTRDWVPVAIGFGASVVSLLIFGTDMLIPALAFSLGALIIFRGRKAV